jgi:prepilin-type N-terminal cleavage/methylation domain-containing protein
MSRNSYGFTMVEVIIVLLILGIVSAVAVPALNSSLDEMKLDGAAREVVSAIYYAQSIAIKEGVQHGVKFFLEVEQFKCIRQGNTILNPHDKKPYIVDFKAEGHLKGVNVVNANFGGIQRVAFNSLGEPISGGTIVLGYAGLQKTINVSLPLGKVSVN